jgi:hypothetical protein
MYVFTYQIQYPTKTKIVVRSDQALLTNKLVFVTSKNETTNLRILFSRIQSAAKYFSYISKVLLPWEPEKLSSVVGTPPIDYRLYSIE